MKNDITPVDDDDMAEQFGSLKGPGIPSSQPPLSTLSGIRELSKFDSIDSEWRSPNLIARESRSRLVNVDFLNR
jgi:hypothetical protein